VVAGLLTTTGPLILPALAPERAESWAVAIVLPGLSAANLILLAVSRHFERYVVGLIVSCMAVAAAVDVSLGGMEASSVGIVFAFLGPVYAILALGPRRATPWLVVFLAVLCGLVLVDPLVRSSITPPPYSARLVFFAWNIGVPATIIFLFLRYTDLRRREAQALADDLLTNAIPPSIAARMKRGERRIAESYPATTVLFADLEGFTPWAQGTDPDRVVAVLDDLFSRFDDLAAEHGVEKIKTIGDAYMAVAGAPDPRPDHAQAGLAMARGMLSAMADARTRLRIPLELRIGLASGSVVAGVIGRRRILFDLWGDTVNIASRMESSGVPGRIQVAPTTRALLDNELPFEAREGVEVKGLGRMTTFLLTEAALR
jgi:adenylate cyclase